MARVSEGILPSGTQLGLSLDRYAEIMLLDTCAFNGVLRPPAPDYYCQCIWTQSMRDKLAMFIAEAEDMREAELGYHLGFKYIEAEKHDYGLPAILDKKYLAGVGAYAVEDIELGAVLNLGDETDPNDPVVILVSTSVTNASEICVMYPDEDVAIRPNSVIISDGVATITIPRCRLVKPELNDDRDDHLNYYDNDNFLETVDVKRCWFDESEGAEFVWRLQDDKCYPDCTTICQPACPQVESHLDWKLSVVYLYPATYDAGSWTGATFSQCRPPDGVRVSYVSGKQSLRNEHLTARLAHSLMPHSPCVACEAVNMYWEADRDKDRSGIITPYGTSTAAIECWMADSRARVGIGGKFPRIRK